MIRTRVIIAAFFVLFAGGVSGKENAFGPWNLDIYGTLNLESNNNVFFEESSPSSDLIWHVIPKIRLEYIKLLNPLFTAELTLNSYLYSENKDANITETYLHMDVKPVNEGAYLVFSEDYQLRQNYSLGGGLVKEGVNILKIGGGYKGNHLDYSLYETLTTASFSPSSDLDFSQNGTQANIEYLFESFYILGGFSFGNINYRDSGFNDGNFWNIIAGIGKKFYPKTSIEFKIRYLNEDHATRDGDDFKGLLYSIEAVHVTMSGKGKTRAILEKKVIPSSIGGSDFTEVLYLRVQSNHSLTPKISGSINGSFKLSSSGSNDYQEIELGIQGSYTPLNIARPKFIRRKRRKRRRTKKPLIRIDFGIISKSLSGNVDAYEFSQLKIFCGATMIY